MSVLIRVRGTKAFFRDGVWMSCDRELEDQLNGVTEEWIGQTGGPPLNDADPEKTCAATVAERLGGSVLLHSPSRGERMRKVFVSKRQLRLF